MTTCVAIGSIGCDLDKIPLSSATGQADIDALSHSRLADQLLSKMEAALTLPKIETSVGSSSKPHGDGSSDQVALEKTALFSGAPNSGTAAGAEVGMSAATSESMEAIKLMYKDITSYTIAWRMAQRVQQDTSTIMKG